MGRNVLPVAAPAATTTPAAATAPISAAGESAAASPASTAAFSGRSSLIHHEISTHEVMAVQGLDSALGFFVAMDFYEAKTTRLPREAVAHQSDVGHAHARLGKPVAQLLFRGLKGQIAHVKLLHQLAPSAHGGGTATGLKAEGRIKFAGSR